MVEQTEVAFLKNQIEKSTAHNKLDELYNEMIRLNHDSVYMILECVKKVELSYQSDKK